MPGKNRVPCEVRWLAPIVSFCNTLCVLRHSSAQDANSRPSAHPIPWLLGFHLLALPDQGKRRAGVAVIHKAPCVVALPMEMVIASQIAEGMGEMIGKRGVSFVGLWKIKLFSQG